MPHQPGLVCAHSSEGVHFERDQACGPGMALDTTSRIHVRLAHTMTDGKEVHTNGPRGPDRYDAM